MLLGRDAIKRLPWFQLAVEAVLVVLSVLLALALNSWRQSAINEGLARQAVRNIQAEVESNRDEVSRRLQYHKTLLDTLQENRDMGIALKPAFIQDDAWETAQATQAAAHIDFDIAAQASRIHGLQTMYREQFVRPAILTLYQGTNSGSAGAQLSMMQDLSAVEQLLLEEYKKLLELIEA